MGWLRKLTGVQAQIDASNTNTNAQVAATKQSAAAQQAALNASARAAASEQAMLAARQQVTAEAEAKANVPQAVADVAIDNTAASPEARRARRASFGKSYSTGVRI